jgi:hypothetical protein
MTTTTAHPSFTIRSFAQGKPGAVVRWPERADAPEDLMWLSPYVPGEETLTFRFSPLENRVEWHAEGGTPGWSGPNARRYLNELLGTEGASFRDHDHCLDPRRVLHAISYFERRGGPQTGNRLTWDQVIAPRARAAAGRGVER